MLPIFRAVATPLFVDKRGRYRYRSHATQILAVVHIGVADLERMDPHQTER